MSFIPGIPQVLPTSLVVLAQPAITWAINILRNTPPDGVQSNSGPFRPPQWSRPQLTSISANIPSGPTEQTGHRILDTGDAGTTTVSPKLIPTTYFFDAVVRVEHSQELRYTEHPLQNGASITDHAYRMPAIVVLDIGMSDAMARYAAGAYTSDRSKSISAFQTLLYLQNLRIPISVKTRLRTYNNMLIAHVRAADTNITTQSLRATVRFAEIITATVATNTISARADQSSSTNEGTKTPLPIPNSITKYNTPSGYSSNVPTGGGGG